MGGVIIIIICGKINTHTVYLTLLEGFTVFHANRIIVVDGGKIIENGSPEELMALKGKYYKLVQIQSMTKKKKKMKEEERF